jgi:hypothetical protein
VIAVIQERFPQGREAGLPMLFGLWETRWEIEALVVFHEQNVSAFRVLALGEQIFTTEKVFSHGSRGVLLKTLCLATAGRLLP